MQLFLSAELSSSPLKASENENWNLYKFRIVVRRNRIVHYREKLAIKMRRIGRGMDRKKKEKRKRRRKNSKISGPVNSICARTLYHSCGNHLNRRKPLLRPCLCTVQRILYRVSVVGNQPLEIDFFSQRVHPYSGRRLRSASALVYTSAETISPAGVPDGIRGNRDKDDGFAGGREAWLPSLSESLEGDHRLRGRCATG